MSELASKRPKITAEMIEAAAVRVAESAHSGPAFSVSTDWLVQLIVSKYSYPMDGYELAKALDGPIDPDSEFVSDMDSMDGVVGDLHREAGWQWVRDNDIQPPLPVGAVIEQGEITGTSDFSPAAYEVKEPDDNSHGICVLIVRYENARPVTGESV